MLIKTKYIDCASKSVFNTWKLPTSAADTSGDIYWSAIVYIQDTGEVWTHGKLYGGFFSNADSNKVSLTIGGTTKILALDGHVQSYTTLTGSGTTADQAILSTGVANKWTLKTLGKNAFSNVDYLPADATAVAAEKVVNAMRFQYNGKDMHSFDGSAARLLNIIQGDNVFITGDSQGNVTIAADPGSDTVNTAGATNLIDKKLFLIGAESQTTSPQTYSNQYVYIGTDNCLYSLGKKVLTEHQAIYNLDLQTQVGDAVTKVTTFDPNAANNSFTLVQGTNVTLIPDATNKKVTISSKDTTYDFYNLIFKQGDTVVDTYKPTTSPNKSFKAGTNVTFTKSGDEITVTTQDTRNTAGATEKLATKLFLTGSLTQTDNPQTYTNSKVYIGADNKLYSDGKVVSTGDHTHKYAGATTPGGPALKVGLNPSGLLDATYGSYSGILQDPNNGPATGFWSSRIKILHNNTSGYYTELAQAMTGTAGLWHRRNVAGVVSDWTPVIDKANFRTYLDATYVIRGNDPNVLTNYVRYSIASGLTMNWKAGNATPTHIWGAKNSDSSKAYVFNGDNIRAFANAVNRAGDTMTGKLTISTSGGGNQLTLNNTAGGESYFYLQSAGSNKGAFTTMQPSYGTCIFDATSSKYLGIKTNGTPHFQGNTLWHAGNDGSGSGLNADFLDGYHATALGVIYTFNTHNVYFCLGTATMPQNGSSINFKVTTGNGYNASVSQCRNFNIYIRTSNGNASSGKYYAGHVEYGYYGSGGCNVYVVQNSSTSFTIWIGNTNHTGQSHFTASYSSNVSFSYSGQTSSGLPSGATQLTQVQYMYSDKTFSTLTLKANGTTVATYNGSSNVTYNINYSSVGAAPTSHTHDDRYYTETESDGRYFRDRGILNSVNPNVLVNGAYYSTSTSPVSGAYSCGILLNFRANPDNFQMYHPDNSADLWFRSNWNSQSTAGGTWTKVWTNRNLDISTYAPLSRLKKARIPGEVVDLFVYKVGSYRATSTDYTTFKNQLFESNGRGKSSVTYQPSYASSTTYTVDLSDFILAYNAISTYSNGMYTAGAGELESNRVGQSVGANSKTISGLEMPKHAHWFGHYRSDNANDRDVFGPDGGQNHSTNGTTSAGQGGNWRTGYSGNGQSKDWRPKTLLVFKMVYMPQSW